MSNYPFHNDLELKRAPGPGPFSSFCPKMSTSIFARIPLGLLTSTMRLRPDDTDISIDLTNVKKSALSYLKRIFQIQAELMHHDLKSKLTLVVNK